MVGVKGTEEDKKKAVKVERKEQGRKLKGLRGVLPRCRLAQFHSGEEEEEDWVRRRGGRRG